MELIPIDSNPNHPTYYSCKKRNDRKQDPWFCMKDSMMSYNANKHEYQIGVVPHYMPTILHRQYLKLSFAENVVIVSEEK